MESSAMLRILTETESRSKHNEQEIEKIQNEVAEIKRENQAIHDIATSVKLIAQDVGYIKDDISAVKTSQADLQSELSEVKNTSTKQKAQWLDKVIGAILGVIGTGILVFILNAIAPNIFS